MDPFHSQIITNIANCNSYMVIATTRNITPWICPLAYWTSNIHFYFVSHNDSKHITNILSNSRVAIAIFDSTLSEGTGDQTGLQFLASAKILASTDQYEIDQALASLQRRFPGNTL